ncbi:MAG: hypothetical protein ABI633_04920 [Burkholderiales bacterium]
MDEHAGLLPSADPRARGAQGNPVSTLVTQLRARPRLITASITGIALATLLPAALPAIERALLGWNAGVWLYLLLVWRNMSRLDQGRLRSRRRRKPRTSPSRHARCAAL